MVLIVKLGITETPVAFSTFVDNTTNGCIAQVAPLPFSKPHSAAFLDLNGDCSSDFFFTTTDGSKKYHEIWIKTANQNNHPVYCLVYQKVVDSSSSQVSFSDVDRNGRIDMIYAVKDKIYLLRNQLPMPEVGGNDCESFTIIQAQNMFIPPESNDFNSTGWMKSLAANSISNLYGTDLHPATIRLGDFDIDGYPDFLITVNSTAGKTTTYLCLNNDGYMDDIGSCMTISENSVLGAFFDFDEDGYCLDVKFC